MTASEQFEIKHAEFVLSVAKLEQIPEAKPEFAFLGRSNVGKSSLINSLTNKRKLASISKTPGKTKLLNYFLINHNFYFVDLPGYGYAKVSKKERDKWSRLIYSYLEQTAFLRALFLLFDCRHGLKDMDYMMIDTLDSLNIPTYYVATKRDKLSGNQWSKQLKKIENQFTAETKVFPYSTTKKIGRFEILNTIETLLGAG